MRCCRPARSRRRTRPGKTQRLRERRFGVLPFAFILFRQFLGTARMVDDLGAGQAPHDLPGGAEFVPQRQRGLDHHQVRLQPKRFAQQRVGVVDHADRIEFERQHRLHSRRNRCPVGRDHNRFLLGIIHNATPRIYASFPKVTNN
jgi:hypothetical protein